MEFILVICIQPVNCPSSGIKTRRHDSPSCGICSKPHFSFPPQAAWYKPAPEFGLCRRCSMTSELCNKAAPWAQSFVLSILHCPVWQLWLWGCTRWDGNSPLGAETFVHQIPVPARGRSCAKGRHRGHLSLAAGFISSAGCISLLSCKDCVSTTARVCKLGKYLLLNVVSVFTPIFLSLTLKQWKSI